MRFLNIIKDGIENVVDEALYEATYKPAGWKVVGDSSVKVELTNSPDDEIIKKNTHKMQMVTPQEFNDKLLKGEGNGKV